MKWLHFIIYLIRKGRLRARPRNFEAERRKLLASSSAWARRTVSRSSPYSIPKSHFRYMVAANVAYIRDASEMNKMFFVSQSHRLIYLRILKCGSSSLLKGFLPLIDGQPDASELNEAEIDALSYYLSTRKIDESQQDFRKFAVIRNPLHRLVSVYLDLFDPKADFSLDTYWFGILRQGMTFPAMVNAIAHVPVQYLGPHFAPQSFILEQCGMREGARLYRLDKDNEMLEAFLHKEGIQWSHLNRHEPYDYRDYYDRHTMDQVLEIYKHDIDSFDYRKEADDLRQRVMSQE